MTRPPRGAVAALAAGMLAGSAAAAAAVAGAEARWVAAAAALALAALGAALAMWASRLTSGPPATERRTVGGPDLRRRVLLIWAGAAAATGAAVAVAIPGARRVDRAVGALARTSWAPGIRMVSADGEPIRPEDVDDGDLLTAYPDHDVGAHDAQALILRQDPALIRVEAGREDWSHDGLLAYSKLCTHMACPVGLYEDRFGTLLCPCHQAIFDLRRGGRVLRGPARRPLPQLPIGVDDDGFLEARGDFSDAVGTGFWYRP